MTTLLKEFDLSKLSFMQPDEADYIRVLYNGHKLLFQTPRVPLNRLHQLCALEHSSKSNFIGLACDNKLGGFLMDLDSHIIKEDLASKLMYESCISIKGDLRIRIPANYNDYAVYDKDRNPIKLIGKIRPYSDVVTKIECTGIWIKNNKYGLSWTLRQMQVFEDEQLKELVIGDDDTDDFINE